MTASAVATFARARRDEGRFYFRVGHNDHIVLTRLIAERRLHADGLVIDARRHDRHKTLRQHAGRVDIATCLDTQAMELAMPGTTSKGHAALPWAELAARDQADFSARHVEKFVRAIVARLVEGGYEQVIAPAHYIPGVGSEWLGTDESLTSELRDQLNALGRETVGIIYPLAIHHSAFYDARSRAVLKRVLRSLPIETVTLRVHPFGSESGPLVIRSFIEACRDLREAGVRLMVERAGIASVASYALGAVGAIQSAITTGDSFDVGSLQKPAPVKRKGGFPRRVYIQSVGTTVDRKVAEHLLSSNRGKLHFACQERTCCPDGYESMLSDPERHSALARQRQYLELSKVPPSLRAGYFIDTMVTPICDMLARASDLHPPFRDAQRRMLSIKEVLADLMQGDKQVTGRPMETRRVSHTSAQIITLTPREPKGR